jgi:predicted phage terminase large subunit-like protein
MNEGPPKTFLGPQPGPQSKFLATSAHIAIFGGAAGGGKSFGLLLEPLYHFENPRFGGVIFRRNTTQIRNEGGLWDESMELYIQVGGRPREAALEWVFPSGARVKFAHLEYDKTVYEWQGSQIPFIGFDELCHFSETQFWYMLSRNRSMSGVPGYIRATCNPDPDSWVRRFIDWWIGPEGFPIKERCGKLRWFIRQNNELIWANTKEELLKKFGTGPEISPKSVTFIPAKLEDNKILMKKDPSYLGNLLALSNVDRMRLKEGNWNIRASAGDFFKREWFPLVDAIPGGWKDVGRGWDRAATEESHSNPDPDWTRGVKMYSYPDGTYCIADLKSARGSPGKVERLIKTVAQHDGISVKIRGYQDPGSAGVKEADDFMKLLSGFDVRVETVSDKKALRAKPFSRQCEYGNVKVLRAAWNDELFREFENFSEDPKEYAHDDIVDGASLIFNELNGGGVSMVDVNAGLAAAFGIG